SLEPERPCCTATPTDLAPVDHQSPAPGSEEKYLSNLSFSSLYWSASGKAGFFEVILGHLSAYSRLTSSHFSKSGSVSGLMASTGHSGSHTPQSMHSSGWMTNILSPS